MPGTPRNAMEGQLNHTLNVGVVPVHVRFKDPHDHRLSVTLRRTLACGTSS